MTQPTSLVVVSQRALIPVLWLLGSSGCGGGSEPPENENLPPQEEAPSENENLPEEGPTDVVQLVAGDQHSCALRRNGKVACWGAGEALGAAESSVVPAQDIARLSLARAISAGPETTCAITTEGSVECWSAEVVQVQKAGAQDFDSASAVALGLGFGCATDAEGVHCWGENTRGQLAQPLELATSTSALAALVEPQVLIGAGETVVVHNGVDRLCAWGDNAAKQVTASEAIGLYTTPECATLADVVQVAVGAVHVCALYATGSASCWGERYYGQLGNGGSDEDTADVAPYGTAALLPAAVAALALGTSHSCALLENGAVYCFGLNHLGQVGPGVPPSEDQVRIPVEVTGFSGQVIAIGSGSSADHTCAVIDDGSVQCWGNNDAGQLGNGVTGVEEGRFSATPVTVVGNL